MKKRKPLMDYTGYRIGPYVGIRMVGHSETYSAYVWLWQHNDGSYRESVASNLRVIYQYKAAGSARQSWSCMKQRCSNPNRPDYYRYGGRGTTYCKRWELYKNFIEDMGSRPPGTTLDRIDPYGNYEPSNCRWATIKQQSFNKKHIKK